MMTVPVLAHPTTTERLVAALRKSGLPTFPVRRTPRRVEVETWLRPLTNGVRGDKPVSMRIVLTMDAGCTVRVVHRGTVHFERDHIALMDLPDVLARLNSDGPTALRPPCA